MVTCVRAACILFTAILIVGCGPSGPKKLTEFANRPINEEAVGKVISTDSNEMGAELPNGTKVYFSKHHHSGGFPPESVKTLRIVKTSGEELSIDFGQNHSGYLSAEIRCSEDLTKVWVVDTHEDHMHMYSGAAIDLNSGKCYGEGTDSWATPWARPDSGKLVIRRELF